MTQETEQKLVPVEPTEAMVDAGVAIPCAEDERTDVVNIWQTMCAAAPSPDTGGMGDQRAEFEAWYCADAAKHGLTFTPAEICSMRDGDGYGPERVAINSKWEGWQARAALSAPVSGEAVARLETWADALEADPGRAAHFGCVPAERIRPVYWNGDMAKDIRAILALISPAQREGEG